MDTWDIVIVGGGPAGLMAGARSAMRGMRTLLLEKNRKPGVKILISGGTRCNFTHATDERGIVQAFGPSGRFLHSALAAFGPRDIVEFFQSEGVAAKTETDTGKVFPASDRASDILAVLLRRLRQSGCTLAADEPLQNIEKSQNGFLLSTPQRTIFAAKVLLATGGKSYPACGTTGDGYRWAAALGHTIVPPRTALVPVTTHAAWVTALQGITIPDVLVKVIEPAIAENGKPYCLANQRGSFLFTHFGLSGPAVLDVSRVISSYSRDCPDFCASKNGTVPFAKPTPQKIILQCDFLPIVKQDELDEMIAAECVLAGQKQVAAVFDRWLPRRLADALLDQAKVPSQRRGAELSKAERRRLVQAIKQSPIPVAGTMGFRKAEVTAGGVTLDEVDSRTMQSKIVPGIYFAGELLDLDGPIGGYNFQAAFSTGYLAGESM